MTGQFSGWFMDNALWVLLAIGTAATFGWLFALRKRLEMNWKAAILVALFHTLYGVFTVKVFAFMESGFDANASGNMSLFGAVFFMPPLYWIGAKLSGRSFKEVFDVMTPCMIFTLLCARVNCLVAGCCRGMIIPGMNSLRFPTREAEIIFYIVLLLYLCPRVFSERTYGNVYPVYMISYGIFRFVTEFFREADTGSVFHMAHLWAIIALTLGISIYVEISRGKYHGKEEKND